MPDSRLKSLPATLLLKEDHHRIREFLEKYGELGPEESEQKEDIFAMIRAELSDHATVEEEIFYPAVAQVDSPDAQPAVQEAQEEHRIVRLLLDEMSELAPGEVEFEAKLKVLKENVLGHAQEEEKRIFKLFKRLPRDVQEDVSDRMRERKGELGDSAF